MPGSTPRTGRWAAVVAICGVFAGSATAQTPVPSSQPTVETTPASPLAAQVAKLGDFDYDTRTAAAQAVRRAPASEAGPVLVAAITTSLDSYVRFKAFVLLTGLLDPRLEDFARAALTDKNDRLRQAAFDWLERHPVPALAPRLIQLVETEQSEFVRPSLLRALAALDADPTVRTALTREVSRGLDIFRGAVIEALGLRRAAYARAAIATVAASEGPLRDVAAMALARFGQTRLVDMPLPRGRSRAGTGEGQEPGRRAGAPRQPVDCRGTHRRRPRGRAAHLAVGSRAADCGSVRATAGAARRTRRRPGDVAACRSRCCGRP